MAPLRRFLGVQPAQEIEEERRRRLRNDAQRLRRAASRGPGHPIQIRVEVSGRRFRLSPACCFPGYNNQPLPDGFESRLDNCGRLYFLDHKNRTTSWDRPPTIIPQQIRGIIYGLIQRGLRYAGAYQHDGEYWTDYSLSVYFRNGAKLWAGLDDRSMYHTDGPMSVIPGPPPGQFDSELQFATTGVIEVIKLLSQGEPPILPSGPQPPFSPEHLPLYEPGEYGRRYAIRHPNLDFDDASLELSRIIPDPSAEDPRGQSTGLREAGRVPMLSESELERVRSLRNSAQNLRRDSQSQEVRRSVLERRRQERDVSEHELGNIRELVRELRSQEPIEVAQERREEQRNRSRAVRQARVARLHRAAFNYDPTIRMADVVPLDLLDIGPMSKTCAKCSARRYKCELPGFCCSQGKVIVPVVQEPPPEVATYFSRDRPEHKEFMKNIRVYNSRFSMTSFGCTRAGERGWDPCFRVQGQVYHRIGALLPDQAHAANCLQIYFLGEEAQEERRMVLRAGEVSSGSVLNQTTVRFLQDFLLRSNRLITKFRATMEIMPETTEQVVLRSERIPRGEHPGRYNAPTGAETSILIVNGERGESREIIIRRKDMSLQRISEMHPSYDALQYPLIFWSGNETYSFRLIRCLDRNGEEMPNSYVTTHQYYCYLLQIRQDPSSNFLMRCGQLLNQFVVDMWAKVEAERLRYLRLNQAESRAEDYIHLRDALAGDGDESDIGQRVILPSTFIGGPRNMQEYTQDAMAMVRVFGRPSLFITMTCNPQWPEIQRELQENEQATDRHDVVSRVFEAKVKQLIKILRVEQLFGPINAFVYSIEWQKRGLPHIHFLLWLISPLHPSDIDDIISAEIPDKRDDPELFELITTKMRHGPCGSLDPDQVCMQPIPNNPRGLRKCTKDFPKAFVRATITNQDDYPAYRRRRPEDGGHTFDTTHKGTLIIVDNRWIVPHCPFLMKVFKTHMNVEFCHSVTAIKYLFKYINKGVDMSMFQTETVNRDAINRHDEITSYQTARYLSASEAFWKFYSFSIHGRQPPVQELEVHLENYQRVYFREGQAAEVAARGARRTTLTSFFELCDRDPQNTRNLLYADVPRNYTYNRMRGFMPRSHQHVYQIGRLYTVHPNIGECYFLRLLLTHRCGPRGFEDIKTIDGQVYPTFRSACQALGLLENDEHLERGLQEACSDRMPNECRRLFAIILIHSEPSCPIDLWTKFRDSLSEDIRYRHVTHGLHLSEDEIYNECLISIEDLTLSMAGKSFGDGPDQIPLPRTNREQFNRANYEIARELNYDIEELETRCEQAIPMLTEEQLSVFNEVCRCIRLREPKLFFFGCPGRHRKNILINLLLAKVRSHRRIILACASSGIAATLMDGGRTAHSTFGIPIKHRPVPMCSVKRGTKKAELFQKCDAIIWDECTMSRKEDIEAVHRTMQDIRQNKSDLFGGLTVLFSGDFRQTLPVIPKSTPADSINACIKNSSLWPSINRRCLTRNMRVHVHNEPGAASFSSLLLRIGEGRVPTSATGMITVNLNLGTPVATIDSLIDAVFSDISANIGNRCWLRERAILASLNSDVDELNSMIQNRLTSSHGSRTYWSVDTCIAANDAVNFPFEALNAFEISNFPKHKLELRIGSPIMAIRNIDPPMICNGTRLCVIQLKPNLIVADILTGPGQGTQVCIPRIKLISDDDFVCRFRRTQFPVRLAYAVTINKAQGQTLKVAGLHLLNNDCFSHGQLYVACSRVGKRSNLFILCKDNHTRNVVYPEVL